MQGREINATGVLTNVRCGASTHPFVVHFIGTKPGHRSIIHTQRNTHTHSELCVNSNGQIKPFYLPET